MRTHLFNAGITRAGRVPTPQYRRFNRYRTSSFYGQFLELDGGGDIDNSEFTQGTQVPILLFLSDYPARIVAHSRYRDIVYHNGGALNSGPLSLAEDSAITRSPGIAPFTQVITTQQTSLGIGELCVGTTPTNGVPTAGYLGYVNVRTSNYENDAIGTKSTPWLFLDVTACSASIDAPVPTGGAATLDNGFPVTAPICALLRENDYTQDMLDAGNVFTATGIEVHIVGLHEVSVTAIPGG